MKQIFFSLLCTLCVVAVNAQTSTRYLRITQLDKTVTEIADNTIDSVHFITKTNSTLNLNGHEFVDLGLSVMWATCNVGATAPEEYGNYFSWGETEPKADNNYSWNTYKYGSSGGSVTKYTKNENVIILDSIDDAASVNWGGAWRTPTYAEYQELINWCNWSWTANYNDTGVAGYLVISKINNSSIFLPAGGNYSGTTHYSKGETGVYWTSEVVGGYNAYRHYMNFSSSSSKGSMSNAEPIYGTSIRPVYSPL